MKNIILLILLFASNVFATNLAPVLKQRFFDQNGNPLSGGKLYSYQAGTTTPQATYTDKSGSTPNANPIILDANGEANVWINPDLSYKFILRSSTDSLQWTTDNVTQDTISIAKGGTGQTTASGALNALLPLQTSQSGKYLKTNGTSANWASAPADTPNPTIRRYTASGTHNIAFYFEISLGSATAGATYTNNGVTYTVVETVAFGTSIRLSGNGLPTDLGTLVKSGGTGDSTIFFSSYKKPKRLIVEIIGGGGGGAGSGSNNAQTEGGAGGTTSFGASLISCLGGYGGQVSGGTNPSGFAGGLGGACSANSPAIVIISMTGNQGASAIGALATGNPGGAGGCGPWGGAGSGNTSTAGRSAIANSGAGGGGGAGGSGITSGAGGGAGGYQKVMIPIGTTYSFAVTIGGGGGAGAAGASGFLGGVGGSGFAVVFDEY